MLLSKMISFSVLIFKRVIATTSFSIESITYMKDTLAIMLILPTLPITLLVLARLLLLGITRVLESMDYLPWCSQY